jgi:hypothetical protein
MAESGELELRFREHDHTDEPPNIEAFARPGFSAPNLPLQKRPEQIAVWGGRRALQPDASLKIFFRYAGHGVPKIESPLGLPDVSNWSVRPTLFGYLATVPPAHRRPSRPSRAWIVAACLPLALASEAMAAPERDAPAVQRPDKAVSVPDPFDASGEPGADPFVEPGTDSSVEGEAADAEPMPASAPERESTEDAKPVPPEAPAAGPVGPDRALVDAAWEGVDGFDVVLTLKGGREMRGRVGAVQHETFTLIQADTGMVLVLPKSGVVSLRVRVPPAPPDKTGIGLIVGGSIFTSVGSPVFLSGLVLLGICPSCTSLHLPLLLVGAGALGAGIPMLMRGAKQRRVYNEAVRERALSPMISRSSHGWTGGVRFRF